MFWTEGGEAVSDNITLPRAVVEQVRVALEESSMRFFLLAAYCDASVNGVKPSIGHAKAKAALAALDAALAEPEPDAIARAVEAEREAILEHCEAMRRAHAGYQTPPGLMQLIYAIRARGSKT